MAAARGSCASPPSTPTSSGSTSTWPSASSTSGPGPNGTEEATQAKVDLVREAAGDRFDDIELQVRVHAVVVTDDRQGMAELLAPALGISPAAALASPHALAGTPDEIVDDLLARRERWGISYLGVSIDALDALAPVVATLAGT